MRSAWAAAIVALASSGVHVHDIQGAGHTSPLAGQDVSDVEGVVTQLTSHGFFMEDTEPDGDDATSEGIRVSTDLVVEIGDLVRVAGDVREARPGCAACSASSDAYANLTTTEIVARDIVVLGHGVALPEPVRIGSEEDARHPPAATIENDAVGDVERANVFDPDEDGLDFYESLEGMRVRIDQARAVGPTAHPAGRGAEVAVVPSAGIGYGPFASRGALVRTPDDDNPERILVSSGEGVRIPDLDAGDELAGPVEGVVDYSFGQYKVVAAKVPLGLRLGPAREASAPPAPRSGELTVATFNVQNFGPTSPPAKVRAIAELIARDLGAPDVVVLQEIQDDSGPVDDGTTAAGRTAGALVEALVERGAPAYAFRDVPPGDGEDGGDPGANIRVGVLLREDRGLELVERGVATAAGTAAVRDAAGGPALSESPGRIEPTSDAFTRSRKPLAVELRFAGRPIFVLGLHLKSQIGDEPSFGRFQPPERATRVQRVEQARAVARLARQLVDLDPGAAVLVAGDLNDVVGSPPLIALEEAGLSDLVAKLPPADRYSHVFEGDAELLDHVLASSRLAESAVDVRIVHANADFFDGVSDHDPVLVRFDVSALAIEREAPGCSCAFSRADSVRSKGATAMLFAVWLARRGRRRQVARRGGRGVVLSARGFSGNHLAP